MSGRTQRIKVKDPDYFLKWLLKETKQKNLTTMVRGAGYSDSYPSYIRTDKTAAYSFCCSVAQSYSINLSDVIKAANTKESQDIKTKAVMDSNAESISKNFDVGGVLELLTEQNQLLKEIGKILTNIETITENAWK